MTEDVNGLYSKACDAFLIGFQGLQGMKGKNSKSKSLHAPTADNLYDLVQKLP